MGDSAGAPVLAECGEEPFLETAWTEAIEATELLRTVLAALGLADDFPRLRGDVNVYGRPMVTVGRIGTDAARRLAAALNRAVTEDVHPLREYRATAIQFGSAEPYSLAPPLPVPLPAPTPPPSAQALLLPPLPPPLAPALPLPPATAARPICEQRSLPFRTDVAELHEMRSDPQRLPA